MKKLLLMISWVAMMYSCKTPGETPENSKKDGVGLVASPKQEVAAPKDQGGKVSEIVLRKRVGFLSKGEGAQKKQEPVTCEVTWQHEKVAGQKDQVGKWLEAAARDELQTGYHIVARIPSVEIWGYRPSSTGPAEEILLLEDYSVMKYRGSEAAQKLVELANNACPQSK